MAMFCGRYSTLESSLVTRCTDSSKRYEPDVALVMVESLLVQLPRLVCLIRSAMEDPRDLQGRINASDLTQSIYDSAEDMYVKNTLYRHITNVPSANTETDQPYDSIFVFDSLDTFVLAIRYYLYRVLICGLLLRIKSIDADVLPMGLTSIEEADMEAAMSVSRCLEYALRPAPSRPMTALGMMIPLQTAIGTWHRLRKRQISTTTPEYQFARRMEDWSTGAIKDISSIWRCRAMNVMRNELICELFAGGPLLDLVYDYIHVEVGSDR